MMSADFEHNPWNEAAVSASANADAPLPSVIETLKRDRFELLSAYLDGEVTAEERRQVEHWLDTDPTMKRLHSRLLKLRQELQVMPVSPHASSETEATIEQVFERLDRRPKRWAMAGGMAIAAAFVGAVTTMLAPGTLHPNHQFAINTSNSTNTASNEVVSTDLQIALDSPIIEIPRVTDSPAPQAQ